jgi:hypothetical protein
VKTFASTFSYRKRRVPQKGCSIVVTALRYKPEVCWFRDQMNSFFSIYLILPAALGPGLCSDFNRNEYQKQKKDVSGDKSVAGA